MLDKRLRFPSLASRLGIDLGDFPDLPIDYSATGAEPQRPGNHPTEMKTFSAKAEEIQRQWHVIDANGKVLGEVAVAAANLLRGKNKPLFTPHVDCGDYVVIVNAEKVRVTGNKENNKVYTSYSGYVGGQKRETVAKVRSRRPELLLERAVRGMIPHNRLGRQIYRKLKVYNGPEHPHEAQQAQPYEL